MVEWPRRGTESAAIPMACPHEHRQLRVIVAAIGAGLGAWALCLFWLAPTVALFCFDLSSPGSFPTPAQFETSARVSLVVSVAIGIVVAAAVRELGTRGPRPGSRKQA